MNVWRGPPNRHPAVRWPMPWRPLCRRAGRPSWRGRRSPRETRILSGWPRCDEPRAGDFARAVGMPGRHGALVMRWRAACANRSRHCTGAGRAWPSSARTAPARHISCTHCRTPCRLVSGPTTSASTRPGRSTTADPRASGSSCASRGSGAATPEPASSNSEDGWCSSIAIRTTPAWHHVNGHDASTASDGPYSGHALPAPDLLLILDAPGAVLHARKPEHPADVMEAEMVRYRVLSERLPRAELVDATRSPEDVLDDVVARIWRVWARRLDGGR